MNPNKSPESSQNSRSRYILYLKSFLLNSGFRKITLNRQLYAIVTSIHIHSLKQNKNN